MAATKASEQQAGKKKSGEKKKAIWEKENPRSRHQTMTAKEKAKAEKAAKQQGRSKPGLVDNINAEKDSKQRKRVR